MKKLKTHLIAIITSLLPILLCNAQISNVTNGFIANSFNGGNNKWVQNYADELDMASDGTMVTASEWDEAGRCVGVFKNGQPVVLLNANSSNSGCWAFGTSTKATAINNKTLFVNNCEGNVLMFDRLNNYKYNSNVNTGIAEGMTCSGNALYLIKPDGVVQKRNVANLSTVALTFIVTGGYDLAVDTSGNIWVLTTNKEVLKYSALGVATGIKITAQNAWQPSAINYDAYNNLILVSDNGPRRQVIKFNTLGEQVGTFGNEGGISAEPKGIIGDLRFWNIAGSGTDSVGNIYVALNENAVSLRKFNTNGVKQWEVQGLMFTDIASIDPASDGTDIYTINEKISFNYKTQQWALQANTCDRIEFPSDPRNKGTGTAISVALMRRVQGNLLMFATGMYNDYFDIYYFKGEIAVHCKTFKDIGWTIYPDKNGNIWYVSNGRIKKIPLTGFSGAIPVFGTEVDITTTIPMPFTLIERLEYDIDADVMYISGWTSANVNTNNDWGLIGSTVANYPNWSKGNRTASNSAVVPKDVENFYPKCMSVAGDYIFIGGSRDRGKLYVYNSKSLTKVGHIESPTNMGEIGWLDMPFAVQAYKRLNGSYAILVEDNSKGKNILYQWCPFGGCVDTDMKVSITSPSELKVYNNYTPLFIEAVVSMDTSVITKVDFYANDSLLGSDTSEPYNYTWDIPKIGKTKIYAKATSTNNITKQSNFITIPINNGSPIIKIAANKTVFSLEDTVLINTQIINDGSKIDSVVFYANNKVIHVDYDSSFTCSWTKKDVGIVLLQAVAFDNTGKKGVSDIIVISVNNYGIIDNTSKQWTWKNFTFDACPTCYMESAHSTFTSNSTGEVNFTGSTVQLYCETWSEGGLVNVYIDGVLIGKYAQNNQPYGGNQIFANITGLTNTQHVLKVVSVGINWVGIDYIKYYADNNILLPMVGTSEFKNSNVNLTINSAEWKHFPTNNHKSYGVKTNSISNYSVIGNATEVIDTVLGRNVSWTGGTPVIVSNYNKERVLISGIGNGFKFTVPANNDADTIKVYVGGENANGILTAHLSNNASLDYFSAPIAESEKWDILYTIIYNAKQDNQFLEVNWFQASGDGGINLQAASIIGKNEVAPKPIPVDTTNVIGNKNEVFVQIYPNPASNLVTINFKGSNATQQILVEIFDLLGKNIYRTIENNSNEVKVNTANFAKGIYFIHVTNGGKTLNSKLILK